MHRKSRKLICCFNRTITVAICGLRIGTISSLGHQPPQLGSHGLRDGVYDQAHEPASQQHVDLLVEVLPLERRLAQSRREIVGIQARFVPRRNRIRFSINIKKQLPDPARDRRHTSRPERAVLQKNIVPKLLLHFIIKRFFEMCQDSIELSAPRGEIKLIENRQSRSNPGPIVFRPRELDGRDATQSAHFVFEVALHHVHEDDGVRDARRVIRGREARVQCLQRRFPAQLRGNLFREAAGDSPPVVLGTSSSQSVVAHNCVRGELKRQVLAEGEVNRREERILGADVVRDEGRVSVRESFNWLRACQFLRLLLALD